MHTSTTSRCAPLRLAAALLAVAALAGCKGPKARSVDMSGLYASKTGQVAVGKIHVDAIPDGAESAVIHYTEDTALLSPTTKTHDIDIILTGTNSVSSAKGIVKSICNAFVSVAPAVAQAEASAPKGVTVLDRPTAATRADCGDGAACEGGACADRAE